MRIFIVVFALLHGSPAFAEDKFFESNGVKIRYVDQGTGDPVVLVHGNGGSYETWTQTGVLQNLARDYRVVAFDARGHGQSGKPHDPTQYGREMALDIVRLLDHLEIQRAHIVGYSMGSVTTAQLLTIHPDRFLSAALVAGVGRLQWTDRDAQRVEEEASEIERDCVSRSQIYRLAPNGAPKPSEADIKSRSRACFANPNQDRFALAALRRSHGDTVITPSQASAVRVPTLAVVGDQDPALKGVLQLKTLQPAMRVVVVPGATHGGERLVVGRQEFITALREFLTLNRTISHQ